MKEYTGDRIRNVAIVGHGGAGTTSVTEGLLYRSGAITRMGKVEDGATTTDYEPEEIKRGVSVNATLAPVEWRDTKINFIDTPGFADFVAEVKGAFRAVDSALIVVCATSGVQVGTEQCWKLAEEAHLPRIVFVNKMDRENADFDSILDNLRAKIGKRVLPLQLPLGKESGFCGVIDIYKMKAYKANGNDSIEMDIPEEYMEAAKEAHEKMVEAAVEADDDCMMRYLEGETISDKEIMDCLIKGIRQAIIFPVLCGSAYKDIGLGRVMNAIIDYTYPAILNDFTVVNPETGEEEIRDANAPMAALVFKTTSDPFVGRLSFFRVFSGVIKSDSMVYNASREKEERFGTVFTMRGKTQIPMKQVVAGDIGVTTKLQFTATGDTLSDKNSPVLFKPIAFPLPMYTRAIYAKKKGEEEKIASALNRLMDEDPTIIVTRNTATKETLISGMGDQHIEIIMERMKRKFGVEADLRAPIVEYRETIRGTATNVEGKHKKQSGGHGQYGHVIITMEPLPPGSGFEFVDKIMRVIEMTPQHRYQILTKRAERMYEYFQTHKVPDNVWLGVTVECRSVKSRIDLLRLIPAKIHFLSCEPLLESLGILDLTGIEWVIVGGESGQSARQMKEEWVIEIKKQVENQNSVFFFKQWGTWGNDGIKRNKHANGKLLEGKIVQNMPE